MVTAYGGTLADAQADQLLLFGVERQLEIICAAVERLVEIDAGISERITDYGKLSPSAGAQGPVARLVLRREIAEIRLREPRVDVES